MNNEYKYYKDITTGNLIRFHIERDDVPWNPRTEQDGNVGHMMCWHREYRLGDYEENQDKDPDSFINNLLITKIPTKSIINYIKKGKNQNHLNLSYDRTTKEWVLKEEDSIICSHYDLEVMVYEVVENMYMSDKWRLLEKCAEIVDLPLYLYDHGGITMSCNYTYPYNDRWDAGQVGWIYTDRETVLNCCGKFKNKNGNYIKITKRNWKQAAYAILEQEVEIYDMYLVGDVYGIVVEKYNTECEEWEDMDSCWGFYSNKWGDALTNEIALEFGINEKLYDVLQEAI